MPTGYTAGIIDGTTTTFQQFAKQCIRNFGATIHMRDEPSDVEYIERIPSDFHTKAIEEANKFRESMRTKAIKDLKYHNEEHAKDVKRCNESNQWVKDFFKSIK